MTALQTKPLNAFHLSFNSMNEFDFRRLPTFLCVERSAHADKRGWDAHVSFKDGEVVHVHCKGYHVTINGERFEHGDINEACAISAGQPTRRSSNY